MGTLVIAAVLAMAPEQQIVRPDDAPAYILQTAELEPAAPEAVGSISAPAVGPASIAPAQPSGIEVPVIKPGEEIDWATRTARAAWVAAREGQWGVFVSIILMASLSLFSLVFVRSKELRDSLRAYTPEVALAVSVLGYISVAVAAVPQGADLADWWEVIWPAIKTGAAAIGFYEFLVKRGLQFWVPKVIALARRLLTKQQPGQPS